MSPSTPSCSQVRISERSPLRYTGYDLRFICISFHPSSNSHLSHCLQTNPREACYSRSVLGLWYVAGTVLLNTLNCPDTTTTSTRGQPVSSTQASALIPLDIYPGYSNEAMATSPPAKLNYARD